MAGCRRRWRTRGLVQTLDSRRQLKVRGGVSGAYGKANTVCVHRYGLRIRLTGVYSFKPGLSRFDKAPRRFVYRVGRRDLLSGVDRLT
jgi:hypothetical protein